MKRPHRADGVAGAERSEALAPSRRGIALPLPPGRQLDPTEKQKRQRITRNKVA
ncbi:MAG: hypothetical protein ACK4RK_06165 [Gemmataceae bacterium]